jgi:HPt (histidine-containing phosphotransfer) domain-containing protein
MRHNFGARALARLDDLLEKVPSLEVQLRVVNRIIAEREAAERKERAERRQEPGSTLRLVGSVMRQQAESTGDLMRRIQAEQAPQPAYNALAGAVRGANAALGNAGMINSAAAAQVRHAFEREFGHVGREAAPVTRREDWTTQRGEYLRPKAAYDPAQAAWVDDEGNVLLRQKDYKFPEKLPR